MVSILRKYQQPALIAITIIIIAVFVFYWNGNPGRGTGGGFANSTKVANIYGQTVSDTDIKHAVTKFQIAAGLGLNELVQGLTGNAEDQQHALENFVWNSYILDHEADALQIVPSDAEVQDELARVPGFQTDGRFDAVKLTRFVQERLPVLGFSDSVVDELVRDQLKVRKLTELIGSTVDVTPAELKNNFEQANEKMDVSVVRLNTSDVEKSIAISDDDAKKAYDSSPDVYKSDEQRKVTIASFELTGAQKDLKGKDRTDALQKLGTDAWNFDQGVMDKSADFPGLAKTAGAQLSTSALFTINEPDPAEEKIPTLAANAFKLDPNLPNSDVLEGQNGYYVLHLEQTVPARQLSFAEAKPKIIAQLQKDRAAQLMQTKATESHDRILAAVKAGKSFSDAAIGAGLSEEKIEPFTLQTASKVDVPDVQAVIQTSIGLSSGQLSDFVPTESGGLFVYMNSRAKPDMAAAVIGEALMKDQSTRQQQVGAFVEWIRLRKDSARLQIYAQH